MSCLICAGPAERIACQDQWEERKCPQCGHYRMADALVLAMMDQGQIFDVVKARAWLEDKRAGRQFPCLDSGDGLLQT